MVRARVAVLRYTGVGAARGARYGLGERTDLEGRLAVRDVHNQTGTTHSAIARRALTDRLGVGLLSSMGRSTSDNFDQTQEFGLVLRRSRSEPRALYLNQLLREGMAGATAPPPR